MNKSWTDEEIGFVQDHDDWTAKRIAEDLGRSVSSVKNMRKKLRSGWVPVFERWRSSEEDFILANPCMKTVDVAAHLGRTVSSVMSRRQFLAKDRGLNVRFGGNVSPTSVGARPLLAKTCPECGRLLQAKWFMINGRNRNKGARLRICNECRGNSRPSRKRPASMGDIRSSKEAFARVQALTLLGASQTRQPWTEAEFTVLKDPDMTILQKALTLHRTYSATSQACRRNGFDSFKGLGDPERDQWMIDNPNLDRLEEITASLPAPLEAPMVPETPERTAPSWDWDDADLVAS